MAVLDYIIPGYKGYRQRTESRGTDRAFRDYMSAKLKASHDELEQLKMQISMDIGKMDLLTDAEQCTALLTKVRDRLRWANQGFAGTLMGSSEETEAIAAVEKFDQDLETLRENIHTQLMNLTSSVLTSENPKALFFQLMAALRWMDNHLNERESLIRKLLH
jgi:hypothetical protein